MNKKDYIASVKETEVNSKRIKEVIKKYDLSLDDTLMRVISKADAIDFFGEERRALSYKEILDASSLLGIDATKEGIIPVIDSYDGTYIVYILWEKKWARFSIADKIAYKKRDTLEEVL